MASPINKDLSFYLVHMQISQPLHFNTFKKISLPVIQLTVDASQSFRVLSSEADTMYLDS